MEIAYVADDGRKFKSKRKCERYEFEKSLNIPATGLKFKDMFGTELRNYLEEDTYYDVDVIEAPTFDAVYTLYKIHCYTNINGYNDIQSPGIYKWDNSCGCFVKQIDN